MLLLTCPNREGSSYQLTADKSHIVSRTTGDIILAEDQSVSRKHAVIKVLSSSKSGGSCQVTVTDLGSKYGTYVNESTKLEANKPVELKDGDVIKFGCQWNEWRFQSKPLVVTTSTLPSEMKLSLKNLISELGGTVVNDWQESCSHLTMVNILLTTKVVCALASAVPIVTPEYWNRYKEAIEQNRFPPDPDNFVPPMKEVILNKNKVSFAVNTARKNIFSGKIFVFPTEKQMKKFKLLISAAGGNSITFSQCNWGLEEFCDPEIIVMQNLSDDTQCMEAVEQYNDVLSSLKTKGMRPIPESELGLAILMCSLDQYCNPKYDVSKMLLGGGNVSLSQLKAQEELVADTPSMIGDVSVKLERSLEGSPKRNEKLVNVESAHHEPESNSKIWEMETVPFEELNKIPANKERQKTVSVETDLRSGIASSRKRIAENDSENLSAKKPFLDPDPLDALLSETQHGDFELIDICTTKSSKKAESTTESREDRLNGNKRMSVGSGKLCSSDITDICATKSSKKAEGTTETEEDILDGNKRKRAESGESFSADQRKRSRLEEYLTANHSNPGCSKDSENKRTAQSKLSVTSEVRSSKTLAGRLSKEVDASVSEGKTSKTNGTSKGGKESAVLDDFVDEPSTSKGWSNEDQFKKNDNKKPKWNRGMASGILDMIVKMDDLIVERSSPVTSRDVPQHRVNFKRFRKVRPSTFRDSLPEIIGEGDLFCTQN